jgi:ADP-ribose pyrophosphatase
MQISPELMRAAEAAFSADTLAAGNARVRDGVPPPMEPREPFVSWHQMRGKCAMRQRKLQAVVRSKQSLTDGFLKVNRYEFEVDTHTGGKQRLVRDVMERGHSVGVLGYDPVNDAVVLVNEFRPGCLLGGDNPFTDNLVAGGIGGDESPLDAAIREMREETNLELREPVLAHPGAYVSSGGTSEKVAIVIGFVDSTRAGGVHGNADESEDILTVVLPADEFIARVRSGVITDLKTLVAGYWLAEHRDELRSARD